MITSWLALLSDDSDFRAKIWRSSSVYNDSWCRFGTHPWQARIERLQVGWSKWSSIWFTFDWDWESIVWFCETQARSKLPNWFYQSLRCFVKVAYYPLKVYDHQGLETKIYWYIASVQPIEHYLNRDSETFTQYRYLDILIDASCPLERHPVCLYSLCTALSKSK